MTLGQFQTQQEVAIFKSWYGNNDKTLIYLQKSIDFTQPASKEELSAIRMSIQVGHG